jgi:hypothetical protein
VVAESKKRINADHCSPTSSRVGPAEDVPDYEKRLVSVLLLQTLNLPRSQRQATKFFGWAAR